MVSNMSKMLISNPFLFPPTGDNEEERGLFQTRADIVKDYILYSLKDFEKAWETEVESSSNNLREDLFPVPILSPTISTTSTELATPDFEMDMDDELMLDLNNYDLNEFQFSPIYTGNDLDKEGFPQKEKGLSDYSKQDLINTIDQGIGQIDCAEPTMFPASVQYNFDPKGYADAKPDAAETESDMGSQIIDGESMFLGLPVDEDFNSLLAISANDPLPPAQISTVSHPQVSAAAPTTSVYQQHQDVKEETQVSVASPSIITRPSTRQRRKSKQASRNVQDIPMTFHLQNNEESVDLQGLLETEAEDKKPSTSALAGLNGTESRSRDVSASSSVYAPVDSPASVKPRVNRNGEVRRKRKYEIDDPSDPSVKNAKAAKMNRDKKKQQMSLLQNQVNNLNDENQHLKQQLSDLSQSSAQKDQQQRQEIENLQHLLQVEKGKNSANSKQKVTMFDLIKSVTAAVNPPPAVICVSERLAATPMPNPAEMDSIRAMQHVGAPHHSNGNGMDTDTYLTFKVGIGGVPTITFDCENRPQH